MVEIFSQEDGQVEPKATSYEIKWNLKNWKIFKNPANIPKFYPSVQDKTLLPSAGETFSASMNK